MLLALLYDDYHSWFTFMIIGKCTRRFVGHTKDVLSVAFSSDNRQIVSASRDRSIKLWNTLGECKFTIVEDGHTEWVSCVSNESHVISVTSIQIINYSINHSKKTRTLPISYHITGSIPSYS